MVMVPEMNTPAADASLPLSPLPEKPRLPDFSERLSPMLVKELRQGMRSPVFVWGLIVMNFFLALVVSMVMGDPDDRQLHKAFLGAYAALVCGLLPLRAAGALHDELRGNTIDTLLLTRLTGWRIALGKWVAVVAQQGLAAVTVLPYLIVRYFAGGVNVPMEIAWLVIFLMAGMASAAVLTGLSWIRYFIFRAALMIGVTWATGAFCVEVLDELYGYSRDYLLDGMYHEGGWQIFLFLLVPALHLSFFCLDLGASVVGSLVENRAVRRRLVGLSVLLFYVVMFCFWKPASYDMQEFAQIGSAVLFFGTVLVLALQALLEHPLNLPAVVMPMVRRGFPGRVFGRFFYAGWPAGVCYVFVFMVVPAFVAGALTIWQAEEFLKPGWGSSRVMSYRIMGTMVGCGAAMLGLLPMPLVLWRWLAVRRLPWTFWIYCLILFMVLAAAGGVVALSEVMDNPNILKWGMAVPPIGWFCYAEENGRWYMDTPGQFNWPWDVITLVTMTVSMVWWLLAVLIALRAFGLTRQAESEAAAILAEKK